MWSSSAAAPKTHYNILSHNNPQHGEDRFVLCSIYCSTRDFPMCVNMCVFIASASNSALMSTAVTVPDSDTCLRHGQSNHWMHVSWKKKVSTPASSWSISTGHRPLRDVIRRRFREKLIMQMSLIPSGNESLHCRLSPWIWCMTWASVCYWSAAISWQSQRREHVWEIDSFQNKQDNLQNLTKNVQVAAGGLKEEGAILVFSLPQQTKKNT